MGKLRQRPRQPASIYGKTQRTPVTKKAPAKPQSRTGGTYPARLKRSGKSP